MIIEAVKQLLTLQQTNKIGSVPGSIMHSNCCH